MLVKGAETAVLNQLASGPGDVTLDHVNEYAEVCMQTLIPGCPNEIYCRQDYSLRHKERKKKRKNGLTDRQTQPAEIDRQTCGKTYKQTDRRTGAGRAKKRIDRAKKALKERRKEGRKTGSTKKSKETYASFHDCRICTKARVEIRLLSVFTFLPKTPPFTV